MKALVPLLALAMIALAACSDRYPSSPVDNPSTGNTGTNSSNVPTGGLITLYSRDPLARTFSFSRGAYGSVFQEGEVKNSGSDIDYDNYSPGEFTVGIEGGRIGAIADLGADSTLRNRYIGAPYLGGGEILASVKVADGRAMILTDRQHGTYQEMTEGTALLNASPASLAHAPVLLGHIYMARLVDDDNRSHPVVAVWMVTSYPSSHDFVTIRWRVLK